METTIEPVPKLKPQGVVLTVCMGCGVFIRAETHDGPDMKSHGCCATCARQFLVDAGLDPDAVPL